ncbi:hypothetical protein OROGR_026845 [Orobanche gracilis]
MFTHRKLISNDGIKSSRHPRTETESVNSSLDCKESEGLRPSTGFEKPGNALAARKGKLEKNLRPKRSSKASIVAQPSDGTATLKPAPKHVKHTENVTCHCSSLRSHKKLRSTADVKFTSFSFGEMKEKLKCTFGAARKEPKRNICRNYDIAAHERFDFSRLEIPNKQDFDVILEAKKHLLARFKNLNALETVTCKNSLKTLGRILSSSDHDLWPNSPRRDRLHGSGFAEIRSGGSSSKVPNARERTCLSPLLRPNTEVSSRNEYNNENDCTLWMMDTKTTSPVPITDDMDFNGELKIGSILGSQSHTSEVHSDINSYDVNRKMQITDTVQLQKADGTDSVSENKESTCSIYHLDASDGIKYQEEYRSPVSVLDPCFIDSPPSVTLHNGMITQDDDHNNNSDNISGDGHQLKPRCLDFEQCSLDSFSHSPPNSCTQEQNHLWHYVHLILHGSCLNWNRLSETMAQPEELLDSSIFDEAEVLPADCYFDHKLLFHRINEILFEIYRSHICSHPWLAFLKPKIRPVALPELVTDEIMTEADFFLLPRTEKRTLDQILLKDMTRHRSWLDIRLDTEEIVIEISEDLLEDSVLDVLVEFYSGSQWRKQSIFSGGSGVIKIAGIGQLYI